MSAPSASGFFYRPRSERFCLVLTLVPRSLLLTRSETLATQAKFFSLVMTISGHQRKKGNTDLLPLPSL